MSSIGMGLEGLRVEITADGDRRRLVRLDSRVRFDDVTGLGFDSFDSIRRR